MLLRSIFILCFSVVSLFSFAQVDLWGITPHGGQSGNGTIFSFKEGTFTSYYDFDANNTGKNPKFGKLVQATNKKLYGITKGGGLYNAGVLFEYDLSTNVYSVIHHFENLIGLPGSGPTGGLIQASNGRLYGVANIGLDEVIFEFEIETKTYSKVHNFFPTTGIFAGKYLIEGDKNKLLGVTTGGGKYDKGVIFEFDIETKVYTKKIDLYYEIGFSAQAGLTKGKNGKYYGMTERGGENDDGVIFEYDYNNNSYLVKRHFGSFGSKPISLLVEHPNGKFYGVTSRGGSWGMGTMFEYDWQTNSIKNIAIFAPEFEGGTGTAPVGGLVVASNGLIYGLTDHTEYAESYTSYLYQYDVVNEKFSKGNTHPPLSDCTLIEASDGNLYGVSEYGGISSGRLFRIELNGPFFQPVFSFDVSSNGANPQGHLTQAHNNKLYGMTHVGGESNDGVIFEFNPSTKSYTKLVNFDDDQSGPLNGFTLHPNGKLYALIPKGNKEYTYGSIIEFDPEVGVITNNLSFVGFAGASAYLDIGDTPLGNLLLNSNGKMYALTSRGGANSSGTLIEYDPTKHTIVKKFDFNTSTGKKPKGSLAIAANGKLYGTTTEGGTNNYGTVFEFDYKKNTVIKRADFSYIGIHPAGHMTLAVDDNLYGMTSTGIFKFDPATSMLSSSHSLKPPSGCSPEGSFVSSPDGVLYGLTFFGGNHRMGTILSFDPITQTSADIYSFAGPEGSNPQNCSLIIMRKEQSFTLKNQQIFATVGDSPIDISMIIGTSTSDLNVNGWSEKPEVADIVDGMLQINGPGTTDISVFKLGNAEYLPSKSVSFKLEVSNPILGLDDEENRINAYPNPTKGVLFVTTKNDFTSSIQILDLLGNIVMETKIIGTEALDLSSLSPGFYLLRSSSLFLRLEKI